MGTFVVKVIILITLLGSGNTTKIGNAVVDLVDDPILNYVTVEDTRVEAWTTRFDRYDPDRDVYTFEIAYHSPFLSARDHAEVKGEDLLEETIDATMLGINRYFGRG